MGCIWCHKSMAARKGKLYCSTHCRVSHYRYREAIQKFQKAWQETNRLYNNLLTQERLGGDAS